MPRGAPRLSTLVLLALGLGWSQPQTSAAQSAPPDGAGACCLGAHDCELLTPNACAERGGTYQGDGTTCDEPQCAVALTPVIGVNPTSLGFGTLCPGACQDRVVTVRNAVGDPESQLIVSELVIAEPFSLVDPPALPFTIPGDGTQVAITLRYCASGSGPQVGGLNIQSPYALNSPLFVPLNGVADRPPLCDLGGPYFGVPGQPIAFDGRGSSDPGGSIASYAWDFGDGSTGTGPTPTHAYSLLGVYVVGLTVSDGCGSLSSCQTTASVVTNLPPSCDAGGPYSGFPGNPIAMSGAGSHDPDGFIVSYRWNFGDGQTGVGVNQNHTYEQSGIYQVSLLIEDDEGATANCSTIAVVQIGSPNDPPVCDAGGPYNGTIGQPITFDGTGSSDPDGEIVAYAWDFGDGQTGTGPSPQHTYVATGFYSVFLMVTDNEGLSTTCATDAVVGGIPNIPPVCDAGGPYQGMVGQPIAFDGSGSHDPDGEITAYNWQFGDCETGTGPTPSHSYPTAGIYTASLCVTDEDAFTVCCTAEVTVTAPAGRASSFFGKAAESGSMGANPHITLPLHADLSCFGCTPSYPVDCLTFLPTVTIPPNSTTTIYLMVFNYSAVAAVQTAFQWPPDWVFLGAIFDCLPGQITAVVPAPPGGPTAGTVATAFNCMTSGELLILGRLLMRTGPGGCMDQVESTYPNGIHAIDCNLGIDHIPGFGGRLGRVCIGPGGIIACTPLLPVRPSTWGQVKASYR